LTSAVLSTLPPLLFTRIKTRQLGQRLGKLIKPFSR
jgi:hypothetical protein